jgi:TolA-binding protein
VKPFAIALLAGSASALLARSASAAPGAKATTEGTSIATEIRSDDIAKYYQQLEAMKLIDAESGNLESLRKELQVAEELLHDAAFTNAAVALYAIVKSPRYAAFTDFVEFQNAEYDLGVALARSGSYGAALDIIDQTLQRGPSAPYWGPAHRRAVDIAIETRDHKGVLSRIESIKLADPVPPSAAGERAYLRGRIAYETGKLADAEAELISISRKSRMYSSAVYLRGVIRARRGQYKEAAEAMCEIAATPDTDKITFVVDDRYFTVKDLARLGLGRLAHEGSEYDDAYYHYFQIPEDSTYLPDALFEAAWSMYQKRELPTARDLVKEFLKEFPSSPLWPEASLLAGYVELADCEFTTSQKWYDDLVAKLQPIVIDMDRVRKDPDQRRTLFATAITRFREVKQTGEVEGLKPGIEKAATTFDELVALLRLDPRFLRLNDAVRGANELANSAPQVVRQWQNLAAQVKDTNVGKVSGPATLEEEQLRDANATVEDLRRLGKQILAQRSEVARAKREKLMAKEQADKELDYLDDLYAKTEIALSNGLVTADKAAQAVAAQAPGGIKPMIQADIAAARRLDKASHALAKKLSDAGEKLAQGALDRLYDDTRKVLDKAKLGKIDAIIGQKRKLDIEVQDLAAGRFPEELIGRLWNASMIADDEEYWPFEGVYWADEYSGWR